MQIKGSLIFLLSHVLSVWKYELRCFCSMAETHLIWMLNQSWKHATRKLFEEKKIQSKVVLKCFNFQVGTEVSEKNILSA